MGRYSWQREESWWQTPVTFLFTSVAILGFSAPLVLFIWGLIEGSPASQGPIRPKVLDEAGLLSTETIATIESANFPSDVAVVVRTVDSLLSAPLFAAVATDLMERETHWQTVCPRTWHQRHVKRNTPWSKGIYVLVSKEPALIQVRFGERIRLEAYRAGLAMGPSYRRTQEAFSVAQADPQVRGLVMELAQKVPVALDLPWYLDVAKTFASVAFSEIEEFVLPADGAFRRFALRTYAGLLQRVNAAASGWRFIAFSAVCYLVIWAGAQLAVFVLGSRFSVAGLIAGIVVAVLAETTYFIGAFASLLLLSNGRLEDQMLLSDVGLQQFQWVGFGPEYFSAPGGWVLAFITAAVAFFGAAVETMRDAHEASARGETRLNLGFLTAPVAWGALILLLPRAFGFFALFHRTTGSFNSVIRFVRSAIA